MSCGGDGLVLDHQEVGVEVGLDREVEDHWRDVRIASLKE